jgi:hypothetical protein
VNVMGGNCWVQHNWWYVWIGTAGGGTAIMCVLVLVCVRRARGHRRTAIATPTRKWRHPHLHVVYYIAAFNFCISCMQT